MSGGIGIAVSLDAQRYIIYTSLITTLDSNHHFRGFQSMLHEDIPGDRILPEFPTCHVYNHMSGRLLI